MQTLDWVTRFLWYLARAARRKFCFCNPSARSAEKNFASDEFAENTMVERRKACKKYFSVFFYENPNPGAIFFVYVKLLISLLNGALFRLGENFSVRGHGAKFLAALPHQLFKQMVGTPHGSAGLGKKLTCRSSEKKIVRKSRFSLFLRGF